LLITLAGVVGVPSLAALTFWVGRITRSEGKTDAAKAAAAQASTAAADAHHRLDNLNREFGDFKERVAREYVSNFTLNRLEQRMSAEFQQVRERLDKLFDVKA
jgi:hypothetical protein